jgi:hypothetical protein
VADSPFALILASSWPKTTGVAAKIVKKVADLKCMFQTKGKIRVEKGIE